VARAADRPVGAGAGGKSGGKDRDAGAPPPPPPSYQGNLCILSTMMLGFMWNAPM